MISEGKDENTLSETHTPTFQTPQEQGKSKKKQKQDSSEVNDRDPFARILKIPRSN